MTLVLNAAEIVVNADAGECAYQVDVNGPRFVVVTTERHPDAAPGMFGFRLFAREVEQDGTPVLVAGDEISRVQRATVHELSIGSGEAAAFPELLTTSLGEATERVVGLALNHTTVMRQLSRFGIGGAK